MGQIGTPCNVQETSKGNEAETMETNVAAGEAAGAGRADHRLTACACAKPALKRARSRHDHDRRSSDNDVSTRGIV